MNGGQEEDTSPESQSHSSTESVFCLSDVIHAKKTKPKQKNLQKQKTRNFDKEYFFTAATFSAVQSGDGIICRGALL